MLKTLLEVAAGSIVGTDHLQKFLWKNNQDAYTVRTSDDMIVAVVADGCGEGPYSELGARLGSGLLAGSLLRVFDPSDVQKSLDIARQSVLGQLRQTVDLMEAGSFSKFVSDNLLFTLIALIIMDDTTYVVGIGDGVYAVNGETVKIGPFPKNEPPYIVYGGLINSTIAPELVQFTVHKTIPTAELMSALIGTDGVGDLDRAAEKTLPGKKELVGPLSQFWTDDRHFKNPESIRRRLNLINNPASHTDWAAKETTEEFGRLKDDTTLVVVRRRPQPKA